MDTVGYAHLLPDYGYGYLPGTPCRVDARTAFADLTVVCCPIYGSYTTRITGAGLLVCCLAVRGSATVTYTVAQLQHPARYVYFFRFRTFIVYLRCYPMTPFDVTQPRLLY